MQKCNHCSLRPSFYLTTYKERGEGRNKVKTHGSSTTCFDCYSKHMEKGRFDNTILRLKPLAKGVTKGWDEMELRAKSLDDCTPAELRIRAERAEEDLEHHMEFDRARAGESIQFRFEIRVLKEQIKQLKKP